MRDLSSWWLVALLPVILVIGVQFDVVPVPHQMDFLKFKLMRQDYSSYKSLHTAAMGSFYDLKVSALV
jgi:hypothetical protein